MRSTNLLRSLAVAGLALSLFTSAAAADKTVMNIGWSTPADSSYSIPAKKFKELVEKHYNLNQGAESGPSVGCDGDSCTLEVQPASLPQ